MARRALRRSRYLLTTLLLCAAAASTAHAAQSVKFHVTFAPYHLGQGAAIDIGVRIASRSGPAPSPLTELDLRFPSELGLTVGGLGIATCPPGRLEALGPAGCPADSLMGRGSATVEIPFGSNLFPETAELTIIRAPEEEGHIALLFYAVGKDPIIARFEFSGQLLQGPRPNEENIKLELPLIPGLPGGPDGDIVALHATLAPRDLVYYEHLRGHLIRYKPQGVLLPDSCPRGGFVFNTALTFLDGSHTLTRDTVPCTRRH